MASPIPLMGIELIDCARANIKEGLEVAAERCGYGNDIRGFQSQLQQAAQSLGMDISNFSELTKIQQTSDLDNEIGPESPSQF